MLATVVRISGFEEVKGATGVELTTIQNMGWKVITKICEYPRNSLQIYFGIYSILPNRLPELPPIVRRDRPLLTKKFMGAVSQGLLVPLNWCTEWGINPRDLQEGDDLTETLGVKKHIFLEEMGIYPVTDSNLVKFPEWIPKTDEPRVQNCPRVLQEMVGRPSVALIKEDGTSCTMALFKDKFYLCGRNFTHYIHFGNEVTEYENLNASTSHYFSIKDSYQVEENMRENDCCYGLAIQGEIVGPKINKNRGKYTKLRFFVFNIWDIARQQYLDWQDVKLICISLRLEHVREIFECKFPKELSVLATVLELVAKLEYSKGVLAEGAIFKTTDGWTGLKRYSIKAISNEYLLKHGL